MTAAPTATFDSEALRRAEESADAEGMLAQIADGRIVRQANLQAWDS